MRFNVNDYEMVQDRIVRFHKTYPNGAIVNEVIDISADGKRVLVKCSVYKDIKDSIPAGVDIAMDWQSKSRGAEATNWAETSSTSATGRALSLVIGFKGKGRASQEEMMIAQERIIQERIVSEETTSPKAEPKKAETKSIKKQVQEIQKKPEGMSGEDREKQELFGYVKETKAEYEKMMVELNPDIDANDSRMKFPKAVFSNMEKCLGTLGHKRYEQKWEQWLKIHNHFNPKKLEALPDIPEDIGGSEEIDIDNLIATSGIEGVVTEGDLPPVDTEEKFPDFPELDRDIEFKYTPKQISQKQIDWIMGLAKKKGISEQRLGAWILHQFQKTLKACDTKEASMMINCLK